MTECERCASLQQQVTDRDRFIEIDRSIIAQRDARIERERDAAEAERDAARREVERLRAALQHAASVLYRIGSERRTDDAHKINAHVEHIRISRVLKDLPPDPVFD